MLCFVLPIVDNIGKVKSFVPVAVANSSTHASAGMPVTDKPSASGGSMQDKSTRLVEIADELRAIAANGLHWTESEYDKARYDTVMSLAAELLSMADSRSPGEIERIFRGDLNVRTPFVGVDAAIFDDEGRILLVQRKDNERWAMPGGIAEVGETPSHVAVREAWEETGLRVEAERLVGIYDSRLVWSPDAVHLYHLVFICRKSSGELALTNETVAYGYFTQDEAAALPLHRGHVFRIPDAFKAYRGEMQGCVFH
jgi:ADP-ribose pyrophosphatase YjhB (NUDIX family)